MLHSQFVPHIVATVPQNWLGLGHAAFVQKSWLDCGKSLLHTKLGSNHVLFAAMLHSQFVPHIVATNKTGASPFVFCGNAAPNALCSSVCALGHGLARSWPCSLCAEVMVGLW